MSLISESYSRLPTPAATTGVGGAEGEDWSADIVEKEVIADSNRSDRVGLEGNLMRCLELMLVRRVANGRFRGLAQFKIPRTEDIADD